MATPAGRISVLIAGNVYVKRALVRRFLEDDGYEVVGDVVDPEVVVPAILAGRPDAILLDEDLTRQGLSIDQIRAAAPDIRVVAFTAVTQGEGAPPVGADGYLTKGVGLSAVTSTLRRLFAEPFRPVLVGAAAAGAAGLAAASTGEAVTVPEAAPGRDWYRLLAVAAGFLLVIWGAVTAIDTTGGVPGDSDVIAEGPETGSSEFLLQQAELKLGTLLALLEGEEYGSALQVAEEFRFLLDEARRAGADVTDLERQASAALSQLASDIPRETSVTLARLLPGLYPVVQEPSEPQEAPPAIVVTDATDEGGGGGGGNGGNGGGGGDPNEPDPNEPDPNEPDPNEPDPNEPDPNEPDPGEPDPGEPDEPEHPEHPEHPDHPEHPEHPDHPDHPEHPEHPDHPKDKDKDKDK